MERIKSWETITETGISIRHGWQHLAEKHELKINHWGLPAMTGFTIPGSNSLAYKTLITQEMLAKGYLTGNSVYACIDHTVKIVSEYLEQLDPIFALVKECEDGRDVMSLLKGPVCHGGFKRLN
jgi:glutamate-1-semialdehyde 2,1-aminomutase